MGYFSFLSELIGKINIFIEQIVTSGGNWAYLIMFCILFTGAACVLTAPLLPSVSLIFLVTSLCVAGLLNPFATLFSLIAAIILGDLGGYYLGKIIGVKLIAKNRLPFIKESHVEKTQKLYDGVDFLTIVFARFTPIVGSLAQMVAGAINYRIDAFVTRNIISGVIWLLIHFTLGWIFALIPALKNNFVVVTLIMPIFSTMFSILFYIKKNYGSSILTKKT